MDFAMEYQFYKREKCDLERRRTWQNPPESPKESKEFTSCQDVSED